MRGLSLLALFLALIAIPAAEAQPLNDDIANATVLSEPFPIEASGTTVGATTAADDPSCLGNRSNTVWFRFTPDRDMSIESVLGAEAGSVLCAYSGSRGALTELAATESNTEVPVTLDVTAGTTYWLMVASCPATTTCGPSTGGVGTFAMDFIEVVPAPPPNDDFNTPTVVTDPLPFTATEFQGRATTDGDDPFPDCSLSADPEVDRNTVWFSYLPRSSRTVTVTLEGTAYDAGICVYAGNQGAFVEIASGANGVEFRPTPDMTYHFLVTSTAVSDSSSDLLHIRFDAGPPLPLPPNDNAENATALNDPLPTTVDQETEGATTAAGDPRCAPTSAGNVWFTYTPGSHTRVNAGTLGSSPGFAPFVCVFTRAMGSFVEVASRFGSVSFDARRKTTYFIMVEACGEACSSAVARSGHLHLTLQRISPPPNDDWSKARVVGDLPFTDSVRTLGASAAADDPVAGGFSACASSDASVWYRYTPTKNLRLNVNTHASDYETVICAYIGTPGHLKLIDADEGGGPVIGPGAGLTFDARKGVRYSFLVSSCDHCGFGGGGHLSIVFQKALDPVVTVNSRGEIDSGTGAVTIGGRLKCSRPAAVSMYVSLQQNGDGVGTDASFTCTGSNSWSVTMPRVAAGFTPGPASVDLSYTFIDNGERVRVDLLEASVQLR